MDHRPEDGAPPDIISLEEVRAQRRAAQEKRERVHAAAVRRAWQERTLTDAILAKRMTTSDLWDMIRLGIVTDDEKLLPCEDRESPEDYFLWIRKSKGLMTAEDLKEEEAAARPVYPGEPAWRIQERTRTKPRHTIECPLMASSILYGESPPCIEVLRRQAKEPMWVSGRGHLTKPLDEEDPVVRYELRPCALIGFGAYVTVMKPVWAREEDPK
jgi:hypothetical protein